MLTQNAPWLNGGIAHQTIPPVIFTPISMLHQFLLHVVFHIGAHFLPVLVSFIQILLFLLWAAERIQSLPFSLLPCLLLLPLEPVVQYTGSYSQICRATWSQGLSIWNDVGIQLISPSFLFIHKQIMSYHAPENSLLAALVVRPPAVSCFPRMVISLFSLPKSTL